MLIFLFLLTLFASSIDASVREKLAPYEKYLEDGTYGGQDWNRFFVKPKSRYYTFLKAFEHLEKTQGKVVVELGTTHSFVHGGLPGCDSNDTKYWTPHLPERWDWGAGAFTLMAAECLKDLGVKIYTVDINPLALHRNRIMTRQYGDVVQHCLSSSDTFLRNYDLSRKIDLLYLDTGNITPIEPTAQLQLREAKIIVERDVMAPNGIILIDDVRNQTPKRAGETSDLGKSKYALPYLLQNGYELVADEYQVIVRKK